MIAKHLLHHRIVPRCAAGFEHRPVPLGDRLHTHHSQAGKTERDGQILPKASAVRFRTDQQDEQGRRNQCQVDRDPKNPLKVCFISCAS